jgi:putative Mg2+ transporter-C (MgtC) family protein
MTAIADWQPLALRLFLTVAAGFAIGFNRGEHGEPAGLRTTILVCLAASIAMMQANLLLTTAGRPPDSYVIFDLMRFPLGILTGVGFIGAGAIFRQANLLRGVTTAATLWFVTVIGLCLGGGQIALGIAGTAIGLAVLWGLKLVERAIPREKTAWLIVAARPQALPEAKLRAHLQSAQLRITSFGESFVNGEDARHTMRCQVRWRCLPHDTAVPDAIADLARSEGIERLQWKP